MNGNLNLKDIDNEQEAFWVSDFGDEYIERNRNVNLLASNLKFFSDILSPIKAITSVTELGCNIGMNFKAIHHLLPQARLTGVEINPKATALLKKEQPYVDVRVSSILTPLECKADLIFTKGVLIHIHPSNLDSIYENLYKNSLRYILLGEYYNTTPVALDYRGHKNKLFKRDFAGDMLSKYSDLHLSDYGFAYHKDHNFPQDDITWFLLEKS